MPARLSAKIPLFLITSVVAFAAMAADWPQWRGPRRDAVSTETGLLKEWPPGGPPLVWKANGLGEGHATVSVAGDRIFTQGDTGDASFAHALNRADGKGIWTAKVGKAGSLGDRADAPGPRSAPTVSGDLLFVLGQHGELVCLNTKDGKEQWHRDYTSDFGGKVPTWGFAESVLVDGDHVIGTPGGSQGAVIALDEKTGQEVWRCKEFTDPAHYSSPVLAEISGVRQYIVLTPQHVAGVAAKDGKLLWSAPRRGQTAVIPTPIYNDNHVYVTSGYGVGCNLFEILKDASGFKAEEVAYANKVMVNKIGGVVLVGDYIYGNSESKGWTCQEFKSGKALWQEKRPGMGSVIYADGNLYCRDDSGKGTVALIEATPAGYKEHGRFDQPDRSQKPSWAPPVISDGKLYIRDQDVLFCFDVKKK